VRVRAEALDTSALFNQLQAIQQPCILFHAATASK